MTKAKAWVALGVQLVGQALTLGLLPEAWRPYAEAVLVAATAIGVYSVPNKPVAVPAKG